MHLLTNKNHVIIRGFFTNNNNICVKNFHVIMAIADIEVI
jgi:hypothetical protein